MTDAGPRVNQSGFVAVQQNEVADIVPAERLDEVTAALAGAGVDLVEVDVLRGETGARILDVDGTEHGHGAHPVRTVQKLGTAANERENYADALRSGSAVVLVPAHGEVEVERYARTLFEHGGRRVRHFGTYASDRITF